MFFFLPAGVDYYPRRYPVVTWTIIGLNIAVYLVSLAYVLDGGVAARLAIFKTFWLIPSESGW